MEDGFWLLEHGQLVQLRLGTACRGALFSQGDRIRPTDAGVNPVTTQTKGFCTTSTWVWSHLQT